VYPEEKKKEQEEEQEKGSGRQKRKLRNHIGHPSLFMQFTQTGDYYLLQKLARVRRLNEIM
jgi:hypothetical protein